MIIHSDFPKYVEFKFCKNKYIGEHVNSSLPIVDIIFIVVADTGITNKALFKKHLLERSKTWKNNNDVIVSDMTGDTVFKINKEASSGPSVNSPSSHRSRRWIDELRSPTTSKIYCRELMKVHKVHYPSYLREEERLYENVLEAGYVLLLERCVGR